MCALSASASAGTTYESEDNFDFENADITYDDYDNYGKISSFIDCDKWKVTFDYSGKANFYLGNIPAGCNYELSIISSDMTTIIAQSGNIGSADELITVSVEAGQTYYVNIISAAGYSESWNYLFRTKVYPENTISMPLYEQQYDYTCSMASVRMVLASYGIYKSESEIVAKSKSLLPQEYQYQWNYLYNVVSTLNYYLSAAGKDFSYSYTDSSVYVSEAQYEDIMIENIMDGHAVMSLLKINNTNYFVQTTDGHYVVLNGLKYYTNPQSYRLVVSDPFFQYSNIYHIPIAEIYYYNYLHDAHAFVHVN